MVSKRKIIAAACIVMIAAVAYFTTAQKETSLSSESAAKPTSPQTAAGDAAAKHDAPAVAKDAVIEGGSAAHHAPTLAQAKPFVETNEQRQALTDYAKISHKIFLTDADKKEKAHLLHDRAFLQSLTSLITASAAGDYEAGEAQNAALDLLYDALGSDGKDAAAAVLSQAVQDNQVENKDIPLKDRESLAGVKAEALYEWTARDPAAAGQVSGLLPGKVSQQLWQNVQARQERNIASSSAEAAKQK